VGINITRYKKKINTQLDNRSKLNNRPTLGSTLVQPYWKKPTDQMASEEDQQLSIPVNSGIENRGYEKHWEKINR
jgi:hypothetical protein